MHRAAGAATLRVSVTDRCNLRCAYCMPEAGVPLLPRGEIPSLTELASAVAWLVARYGVDRVKVTGGEPLVRGGVPEFVAKLAAIPGRPRDLHDDERDAARGHRSRAGEVGPGASERLARHGRPRPLPRADPRRPRRRGPRRNRRRPRGRPDAAQAELGPSPELLPGRRSRPPRSRCRRRVSRSGSSS